MNRQRIGYLLGIGMVAVMTLDVLRAWIADAPDFADRRGYALFIGATALVFAIAGLRGNHWAGMGFLVVAFGCGFATIHLGREMWVYAALFVVATLLTQWGHFFEGPEAESQTAHSGGTPSAR